MAKSKKNKNKSVNVSTKKVEVEEVVEVEGNGGFELKKFKKADKVARFTMTTPFDYDVKSSVIVSLNLMVQLKKIGKKAEKIKSDSDSLEVGLDTITLMLGEENFNKLLESAAELPSLEEEGKMLGYLSKFIFDELLPKVQGVEKKA